VRPAPLIAALLVLAVTGVCVRLGFWQLSRLDEKRAANAALRAALEAPPLTLAGASVPLDSVRHRRVALSGRYDLRRHILLAGRAHGGSPGVDVVTPLFVEGDSVAVLVDRGWLYAADGASARPQDHDEPDEVRVTGIAEEVPRGTRLGSWLRLRADSVTLWSAITLDRDSLAGRLPYAVAPFYLRQLPGEGVPAQPLRSVPQPLDETMHMSYAAQWFLFGSILFFGSLLFARNRRRARDAEPVPPAPAR